jgi:hypothetical protein
MSIKVSDVVVNFITVLTCLIYVSVNANELNKQFPNKSEIRLSEPLAGESLDLFEPGWGAAEFIGYDGKRTRLLPDEHFTSVGGTIFSEPDFWSISPSGKYVVLLILRTGLLGDPRDRNVAARQYCPVINTQTGCLESIQTGELCAGQWDKKKILGKCLEIKAI